MVDFSPWLNALDAADADVRTVQTFASTLPAGTWPSGNALGPYVTAIPADAAQSARLAALARLYGRWSEEERLRATPQRLGFWRFIGEHFGLIALVLSGVIIAIGLVWGIFISGTFLSLMAQPDHARGLITFLFSFATIAVVVLVAIAVFWMAPSEVEVRFRNAKDLITILVGVLGTVLGFYFGTASTSGPPLSVAALTVPSSVPAGGKVNVLAKAAGGVGPYQCEIQVGGIDTKKIECKVSGTGDVSVEIPISPEMKPQADLPVKLIVRDSRGGQAESAETKLTVTPKQP
jgi:hypothetical protein